MTDRPYTPAGRWTFYKGIRMRSRLEASFAAHLDARDLFWQYEPECYADETGTYLPDFVVRVDGCPPLFYEVKPPTADTRAAMAKMHRILATIPDAWLVVVVPRGTYPYTRWQTVGICHDADMCAPCRGIEFHDLRTIAGADRRVP